MIYLSIHYLSIHIHHIYLSIWHLSLSPSICVCVYVRCVFSVVDAHNLKTLQLFLLNISQVDLYADPSYLKILRLFFGFPLIKVRIYFTYSHIHRPSAAVPLFFQLGDNSQFDSF